MTDVGTNVEIPSCPESKSVSSDFDETKNQMKCVKLSATWLGEAVSLADLRKNFRFIVGKEEREYQCSLVQACFISGKVRQLVATDSTINSLRVLPDEECSVFGFIERLWNGEGIELDTGSVEPLLKLSRELENEELSSLLVNWSFSHGEISVENCLSRLRSKTCLGLDSAKELEFISSKFSEFPLQDLAGLTASEIERVLTHEGLKIEDENSLFDYISDLVSRDESCYSLFKYVRFEYLDSEHLDMFLESVCPECVECVWTSIANFIKNSVKNSPKKPSVRRQVVSSNESGASGGGVFTYNSSSPFGGIISHLGTECGGNPYVNKIIDITTSGLQGGQLSDLVNYNQPGMKNIVSTSSIPNSWFQFDFNERRVSIESYTLEANEYVAPVHWKIEGSNDASSWIELDSQTDSRWQFNSPIRHFTCGNQTGETFRYIRLTQTGQGGGLLSQASHSLMIRCIEFFGNLTP